MDVALADEGAIRARSGREACVGRRFRRPYAVLADGLLAAQAVPPAAGAPRDTRDAPPGATRHPHQTSRAKWCRFPNPLAHRLSDGPPIWKSAIQQVGKPVLRGAGRDARRPLPRRIKKIDKWYKRW